jgi:ABC-type sugar transport system substrate-binding protein
MQKAQNMAQSHPDIDIIFTDYANITRGTVDALQQMGRLSKVKVYDFGGISWSKEAVQKGWVQFTVPLYAYTVAYVAVENMARAYHGKQVPHYIGNDGGPADAPFIIDRSNVAKFKPESD